MLRKWESAEPRNDLLGVRAPDLQNWIREKSVEKPYFTQMWMCFMFIMYFRVCTRWCVYIFILDLSPRTDEVLHLSGWQGISRNREKLNVPIIWCFPYGHKQAIVWQAVFADQSVHNWEQLLRTTFYYIIYYSWILPPCYIECMCAGGQFTLLNGKGCIWKPGLVNWSPTRAAGLWKPVPSKIIYNRGRHGMKLNTAVKTCPEQKKN